MRTYCFNLTIKYKASNSVFNVTLPMEIKASAEAEAWERARDCMSVMKRTLETMHLKCQIVTETIEWFS